MRHINGTTLDVGNLYTLTEAVLGNQFAMVRFGTTFSEPFM